jgi:hypothetical protein
MVIAALETSGGLFAVNPDVAEVALPKVSMDPIGLDFDDNVEKAGKGGDSL